MNHPISKSLAVLILFLNLPAHAMSAKPANPPSTAEETLWVKRSARAASCESEGEPLALARQALTNAKVRVLQEQRGGDGMMHIQVCGADTGAQNFFQIPKGELKQAVSAGFSEAPGFSPKASRSEITDR